MTTATNATTASTRSVTTDNMAMQFYTAHNGTLRTLALPPGLTAEEAIAWARQWQSPAEVMTGIVAYR